MTAGLTRHTRIGLSVNLDLMPLVASPGADPEIEEGGGIHIDWGLVRRA